MQNNNAEFKNSTHVSKYQFRSFSFKVVIFQSIHTYLCATILRNFPLLNNTVIIAVQERQLLHVFPKITSSGILVTVN